MDRAEAHEVAHSELAAIASAGYCAASEHIETVLLKDVLAESGIAYEIELSYLWKDQAHEEIMAICRITSKEWFRHERVEESIILSSRVN